MKIGQAIRARRTEAKLNAKELAVLAGIDPSTLSRYETGLSEPRLDVVAQIEDALGLARGQLLVDVEAILLADNAVVPNRLGIRTWESRFESLTPKQRAAVEALFESYET